MDTKAIVVKRGRPTKYSLKMVKNAQKYLKKCIKKDELPTIEELALALKVATRSIYTWTDTHFEFSQTIDLIQDSQRSMLMKKGLSGEYSASMAIFLLKSIHNYRDYTPAFQATQNNYNLTPEVFADVMKFGEEDK